LQKEHPKSSI